MPLFNHRDALQIVDIIVAALESTGRTKEVEIFKALRPAIEDAGAIKNGNPVIKAGEKGVCKYCQADVIGTDDLSGKPIISHTADCPYEKAQKVR